jgi:nucleotide-binding universal stress UspA family protein
MMDTAQNDSHETKNTVLPDECLPPFAAFQAEEEARANAPAAAEWSGALYRRGRVEAETHRISDEVTREAQQRLDRAQVAPLVSAPTAISTVVVPDASLLPAPLAMKRLLVPLDGTLQGERAIPFVAEIAQLVHASVLLAHVTPTEPPAVVGQMFGLKATKRQEACQAFALEALPYLRRVQSSMAARCGDTVDIVHCTAPTIVDGLLRLERNCSIDLTVLALGAHGESEHVMLGNVVDRVIRLGSAPTLVIPPGVDAGIRPLTLRHILIALDGSPLAQEALAPVAGLLARIPRQPHEQITVTLFGVADNFTLVPEYHGYLDALRVSLQAQPAWVDAHIRAETVVGSPPGAIVSAVNHTSLLHHGGDPDDVRPVDMLVLSTHGRGGVQRWLLGSVATYVLPRVKAPVLVVHPIDRTER